MKRKAIIEDRAAETATVTADLAGRRLDAAAARLLDQHSRTKLQDWIGAGCLSVNGKVQVDPRYSVAEGDAISLRVPPPVEHLDDAQDIKLDIVHEDKSLIVLDKPPGLTVHPGAGQPDGTLLNALLHRYPKARELPRGGLVHRLDKDTSGLLVVALTPTAHALLTKAMQERQIRREYDAVVCGVMAMGGTLRTAFGRHARDRTKMSVMATGRPAVTHYRVVERYAEHTRVRVRLETGRTHQIRVHLQHLRHPVLGDPTYGGRAARSGRLPDELRKTIAAFPRQALHARELEFDHPVTGKRLAFTREAPDDLRKLMLALRRHVRA